MQVGSDGTHTFLKNIKIRVYTFMQMAGRTQQPLLSTLRRRKRAQPPVFNGVSGSYEDKDSDFLW